MIESSESFDAGDFLMGDGSVSMAYHTFELGIPLSLAKSSAKVKKIDLTETSMRNFENLKYFTSVETVVLDKNGLSDISTCPRLQTLKTLWCNNNEISDLPAFLDDVCAKFPSLQYLSFMRNPACPGLMDIVNPDLESIRLYRLYVLYRFPLLRMIDWEEVTETEREEAKRRGQYAVKRKSVAPAVLPAVIVSSGVAGPPARSPGRPEGGGDHGGGSGSGRSGGGGGDGTKIKVAAPIRPDGSKHSEGNRFITNGQL